MFFFLKAELIFCAMSAKFVGVAVLLGFRSFKYLYLIGDFAHSHFASLDDPTWLILGWLERSSFFFVVVGLISIILYHILSGTTSVHRYIISIWYNIYKSISQHHVEHSFCDRARIDMTSASFGKHVHALLTKRYHNARRDRKATWQSEEYFGILWSANFIISYPYTYSTSYIIT